MTEQINPWKEEITSALIHNDEMKVVTMSGIADAFRMSKPTNEFSERWHQWQEDMLAVARVLKEHNSYFSYEKFYIQCGIEPINLRVTDVAE